MPDAKPAAGSERQPARDPVALYYTGDATGEPHIHGVPARDLTRSDVARLAYVEAARTGKRVSAKTVTDRLADTDLYRRTAPARAARKPATATAAKPAATAPRES